MGLLPILPTEMGQVGEIGSPMSKAMRAAEAAADAEREASNEGTVDMMEAMSTKLNIEISDCSRRNPEKLASITLFGRDLLEPLAHTVYYQLEPADRCVSFFASERATTRSSLFLSLARSRSRSLLWIVVLTHGRLPLSLRLSLSLSLSLSP